MWLKIKKCYGLCLMPKELTYSVQVTKIIETIT